MSLYHSIKIFQNTEKKIIGINVFKCEKQKKIRDYRILEMKRRESLDIKDLGIICLCSGRSDYSMREFENQVYQLLVIH